MSAIVATAQRRLGFVGALHSIGVGLCSWTGDRWEKLLHVAYRGVHVSCD